MDPRPAIVLPSRPKGEEEDGLLLVRSASTLQVSGPPPGRRDATVPETSFDSPLGVLDVLRSKPSLRNLLRCIDYLADEHVDPSTQRPFHVRLLGPTASRVVSTLVNDVVPAYWPLLSTDPERRAHWRSLIRCLRSVAGIGAISTRLRALCSLQESQSRRDARSDSDQIYIVLQLLECVLHGDGTLQSIWADVVQHEAEHMRRPMVMDQLSSFLAGGQVLSVAAEASIKTKTPHLPAAGKASSSWVGDGRLYAAWLGRNICHWSRKIEHDRDLAGGKARDRFLNRSLSLGYTEDLGRAMFSRLLEGDADDLPVTRRMLAGLTPASQSALIATLLKLLDGLSASSADPASVVPGVAALLRELVHGNAHLQAYLVRVLTGSSSGGRIFASLTLLRAIVAGLHDEYDLLVQAQLGCLRRFGSKTNIRQDPIMQQETHAKTLLLLVGKIFGRNSDAVREMKSSSDYLEAISNRLAAQSSRCQFLGMVVGMAVSGLVDAKDKQLVFSTPAVESGDGKTYLGLVSVNDQVGQISDLATIPSVAASASAGQGRPSHPSRSPAPSTSLPSSAAAMVKAKAPKPKIIAIEELPDGDESEDDLPVYAKPDSDAEDSDEDATLVNRNKPTAPVYIRDLLSGLRDGENYDRHKLAIETAPGLIRRKTNFGTEVSAHVEELASVLIGLDNTFNVADFNERRLQALIAVLVAKPDEMGPWFANTFFNGDYSMAQRAAILSVIALGARELGGLRDEDADLTGADDAPDFPSKRLPSRDPSLLLKAAATAAAAATSSDPSLPVTRLSGRLERSILQPLALSAADAASGPNVLRVRTFSSRLDKAKQAARTRIIPNKLGASLASAFFFPLTSRWRSLLSARGSSSVFTAAALLSGFLRTLALVYAAAGLAAPARPGLTAEFWALLLGLRNQAAVAELAVVEALLLGFLTLLDAHADAAYAAALVRDHGDDVAQMRDWVDRVLEGVRGGAPEEDRVRVLAAGVMVKAEEIADRYRREMLGPAAADLL